MNKMRPTQIDKDEARQGQRVKGMPSVLALSTGIVAIIFMVTLIASIS